MIRIAIGILLIIAGAFCWSLMRVALGPGNWWGTILMAILIAIGIVIMRKNKAKPK